MSLPSDQELRDYAQSLPKIYQEMLAAFPRIEPGRVAGYGLAVQTIAADLADHSPSFTLGEIVQASTQLEEHGIVEIKHGIFVHPTEYGERLIAASTGKEPKSVTVPDLPPPPG